MTPTGKLIARGGDATQLCLVETTMYYFSGYYKEWRVLAEEEEFISFWVNIHGYTYIKYDTTPFEGNV